MSDTFKGLLFAILGFALLSTMDSVIKSFDNELSVFQIIFFGMVFSVLPLVYLIALNPNANQVRVHTASPWLMTGRVLAAAITLPCVFYAFNTLPMPQVYAIIFAAPIFITLFAIPFLGETVQLYRSTALVVGFIGIIIILRPTVDTLTLGHLAAFIGAILIACGSILNRKIGSSDNSLSMVIYPFLGSIIFCGIAMIWTYKPMSGIELVKLVIIGLLMVAGQFSIVKAYMKAPAAAVAPFQYTQMFWAILYGALFFGDQADFYTYLGTMLVIGSGVFILYRESKVQGSTMPLTNTKQFRGLSIIAPQKLKPNKKNKDDTKPPA